MIPFLNKLKLDPPMLVGVLLLMVFGLFVLFSAAGGDWGSVFHQMALLSVGLFVMWICANIAPSTYQKFAFWLYGIFLTMLFIVLVVGAVSKGAQRWLSLGLFRFQPAEPLKIIMPIVLAAYLKNKVLPPKASTLMICLLMIAVPAVLVAKQPDLGTAVMIAMAGISVLLFAGINWRFLLSSTVAILIGAPALWHFMHDYQKARVLTFLNPERDPLGSGYHIIQSKIALGSGGFFGQGWMHGSQAHLQFLPEHATDFIFAVVGEEMGFFGCLFLLGILLFIVGRGLYISSEGQDTFSRLLAAGLSLTFFSAFFVNIGMVMGILPVVGIPLPLTSYGGSSVLTLMAGFGIIMSIKAHQKLLPS